MRDSQDKAQSQRDYKAYKKKYEYSIAYPKDFWQEVATKYLVWHKPFDEVCKENLLFFEETAEQDLKIEWFINGKLNACYNCLDIHLDKNADKIAYFWQGDELNHQLSITYGELYKKVCRFANVLINLGLKTGDRVCIYLPLTIEAIVAMLACARLGIIHTVVFAGFSANSLSQRIQDAGCSLLVTTDLTRRGGKEVNLFNHVQNLDINILLVKNFYSSELTSVNTDYNNIQQYHLLEDKVSDECPPVFVDSEHPLFILYTSGSTGKPKGVLHTTAGYLLHAIFSFQELFYPTSKDVYWCTADVGWITGHSYLVYGMLGSGVTAVIFAGTPNYPDYDIFWKIIDKYQISILYTAPTVIRALMREGEKHLSSSSRKSLRLLGSVGEPINPEAWNWYYKHIGRQKCPIVDTWWQTETGAVMIAPLANMGNNALKPGCAMLPFYGVDLKILEDNDNIIDERKEKKEGNLVITRPWPGMIRGVYQQPERFKETYFSKFKNYFYTGDLARRDEDGHYWILGRSDDVINIAGHRLGTAEIENALVGHQSVAEAAVIPLPDDIKGQMIVAYVVLKKDNDIKANYSEIEKMLKQHVKNDIGSIALIKKIFFVNSLPKTRSGKIMRRILRSVALGDTNNFGDTSTLLDESMIKYFLRVTHEQGA